MHLAAQKVVEKARKVAAHLLEAAEGDLEFDGGTFSVKGSPDAKTTIQEVALATFAAHDLPDGMEPTINADAVLDPENFSFPHGTHLCAVEVDTETGRTTIRSYVAVDDVGKVINPMIVEGQVHGGIAQGIAQALYEEAVYDAGRQPGDRHDGRLPGAGRAGPAGLHHRPHRDPVHVQPARRQGRRRGRHDRLHAGGGQRGRGRAPALRGATTSGCRARRSGSGGRSTSAAPTAATGLPEGTVAYGGPQTATTAGGAQ